MSPESENNKISIMIVEDSPTQAEQLQFLLENAGYRVTVACNGKEALLKLETEIPNLILSDIVMPEMDGYELCRTIKHLERLRRIQVILVTVMHDPQDVIRGLECGANNFITKPYVEKYLLTRIKSVLADASVEDVDTFQMGLEIFFAGKRHYITSSRMQILNILLSTYETTIQKNQELNGARNQLRDLNEHLEDLVAERTLEHEKTNIKLTDEIEIRKKTEKALQRKTRAYKVISACNHILVRKESEQDFINDICSTLVTVGRYRAAWIGYARDDINKTVEPVARSGFEKIPLNTLQISWKKGRHGNGPTGSSVRTGNPVVIHDIPHNPKYGSWIAEAVERNYSTVAALPLTIKGQVIGALTIYSGDADAFDTDEMQLLLEMAEDLVYGIETLRARTAHEKAEQELKASEIRYRRLFEAAKDGILILDGETGVIVDVNPFLVELLGIPCNQFIGKNIRDTGILIDIASSKDKFNELKKQGYVHYKDLPLKSADGKHIDVEFVSNVYEVNEKKVIQCNIRDITERKLAEEEIRVLKRDLEQRVEERTSELQKTNEALTVTEIRYRRLFEAAQDGILILDADSGQIVEVNPFLITLLGFSREQFLGKKIWEIGLFKDIVANKDNFEELQRKEYVRYEDMPIETADGQRIAMEFVSSVYMVNDKKVIQCNIRDITERKKLEEDLVVKAAELARSNIELQQFAYVTSHDLQEPLRAISGFTELLVKRYHGKMDEKADSYIDFITEGTTRMQQMIQDLLIYSRVQTQVHEFVLVDSNTSFDQALSDLQVATKEHNAIITKDPLPSIYADHEQITKLFQNLIGNAIKFNKPGVAPKVHISAKQDENNWIFSVSDNGIGIDPQYADRIFKIFQRLHTRDEYPGTGIGLAICKRIAEQHGGTIWIESVPDLGSTFYFTIPKRKKETSHK